MGDITNIRLKKLEDIKYHENTIQKKLGDKKNQKIITKKVSGYGHVPQKSWGIYNIMKITLKKLGDITTILLKKVQGYTIS